MLVFVLALKGIMTLMEAKLQKSQVPPPKKSTHEANSLQNQSLREKGRYELNIFAHKSTSSLSDDIWALHLYLPPSHLLGSTDVQWSHPPQQVRNQPERCLQSTPHLLESPHLHLQDLGHSYGFLKHQQIHNSNKPAHGLRAWGGFKLLLETSVHHQHPSSVMGDYPVSCAKGANLSALVLCLPRPHGDPAWPRCGLAPAARYLLSKTHIFRSVNLLRCAPDSCVTSFPGGIKIPLYVENNSCRSLDFLRLKMALILHSSRNQNNKFHVSLRLLWPCTMICAQVRSI